MLSQNVGDPALLVIAATLGNVLGSVFNWLCGTFLLSYMGRWWFPVSKPSYDKASAWFERYGKWSLLLAWLPIVGDPLTLMAGVMRINFWIFLSLVAIGKTSRYIFIAYLLA